MVRDKALSNLLIVMDFIFEALHRFHKYGSQFRQIYLQCQSFDGESYGTPPAGHARECTVIGIHGSNAILGFLHLSRPDRCLFGKFFERLHTAPAIWRIDRMASITLPPLRT